MFNQVLMIDKTLVSVFKMLKHVYFLVLLDENKEKLFQVLCTPNHKLLICPILLPMSPMTFVGKVNDNPVKYAKNRISFINVAKVA
jgi:hypothetical protein